MNKSATISWVLACCGLISLVPGVVAAPPAAVSSANQPAGLQLQTTAVKGSRELPKVLVIVPWKSADAPGPGGRPLASLVEATLTPIDPAVFRRQLRYFTELESAETASEPSSQDSKN